MIITILTKKVKLSFVLTWGSYTPSNPSIMDKHGINIIRVFYYNTRMIVQVFLKSQSFEVIHWNIQSTDYKSRVSTAQRVGKKFSRMAD